MILTKLIEHSHYRVKEAKKNTSLLAIKQQALALPKGTFVFERVLRNKGLSFICEVKKASPSKGIINEKFPYVDIALAYQEGGATAISILTEDKYFLGSNDIFKEIRQVVSIPLLRKDFIVDIYQIYEARILGADAVLIIVALLDGNLEKLKEYLTVCKSLGISALVEAHTAEEIALAIRAGAQIIGVNNRNLKDFSMDFNHAQKMSTKIPEEIVYVAESGVQDVKDVQIIRQLGADACLIGEALMRSSDIKKTLAQFIAGSNHD